MIADAVPPFDDEVTLPEEDENLKDYAVPSFEAEVILSEEDENWI